MRLQPFLVCLGLFLVGTALPARADMADDFQAQQDFDASPPQATPPLSTWISWTTLEQGGEYERGGGQPFAAPVPPNLPPEVTDLLIVTDGGSRKTSSGGVTCYEFWSSEFVLVEFSDGSQFVWSKETLSKSCSDGSSESFVQIITTAGVENSVTGSWSGRVRSWTQDNVATQRRAGFRTSAGGTLDLSSLAASSLPLVGSGYDEVDITVGPAGMLDLRGNPVGNGPLFSTDGPVTLRCDTVLMDPGVVLADLFMPPPIVLPASTVHELALIGSSQAYFDTTGMAEVELGVMNLGNAPELAQLAWSDSAGWSMPPPGPIAIDPLTTPSFVKVPLLLPPGMQPGDTSTLQAQVSSFSAPTTLREAVLLAVPVPPTGSAYCTAKLNSQGCLPKISWTGSPTLTGYDDLMVLASDVLNGMNGILFYGFGQASIPFQGGFLCVQPPVLRTAVQNSGGSAGPPDCSGVYAFHVSQVFMEAGGMAPGATIHCQYWTRDPSAAFGSGLTDAAALPIGP